jgi:G3E family GTPase
VPVCPPSWDPPSSLIHNLQLRVCLQVRGDLIRILNKILKRKKRLDAVLIETTGMADPAPVVQTFFMDEGIQVS